MNTSPAEARHLRTERQLLTIAKQLPVPVLSEARREEMRTALLVGMTPSSEVWRRTKQTRTVAARGRAQLLLFAAILLAGASIAAAAWRIKTRVAPVLEPVEVVASAGDDKTRSVQGPGVGGQFAASAPIPVAAPTLLSPAPMRQAPPRSTRRMAATSTAAAESQANVEVAFARGWIALRSNDFESAAQAFGQAASEGDDNALSEDASFWRGVALDRANRFAEAQEALTQFLVRYPKSDRAGEAAVMLGWLLLRAGDVTAAEARFGSALGNPSERVRRSGRAGLAASGRRHD